MPGQAGRSLAGSQKRDATDATGGIDSTTNEAIQIVEAFLGASSVSLRVRDAWKRVRDAVGKPAGGPGPNEDRKDDTWRGS